MEFIAAIVAIVAIVLVFSLRNRVALLEQHIAFLNQQLAPRRTAPPQAASEPTPQAPPLPADMPAPPAPAEGVKVPAIEQLAQESFAAPPPPPSPPPPPPPAPPAPEAAKTFEERFGASWVVWIGGLALALGGIFMVQYSIEAGLIGPGVRVFLGGLLAAALVAGGEWTRRREFSIGLANVPTAHIPSILTAAGTTVAFATIYAA